MRRSQELTVMEGIALFFSRQMYRKPVTQPAGMIRLNNTELFLERYLKIDIHYRSERDTGSESHTFS